MKFPQVLTSKEISRRVGVTRKTALLLKRRLQLFASDILPRMQRKFYQDMKLMYHDFKFPYDRNADLTEMVKGKPIPQADTVVLFSCSATANKGRKRFKRTGATASIYMSESLGGMQRGTLVSTIGVKQGPVFFDSIPNQKAETLIPAVGKYIPIHTPLFTDEGYKFWPGRNHRSVNHSLKSKDKRHKWSRGRWSKNGVHNNVAEGNQAVIKQAFRAYRWIDPKYSQLYLNEFTMLRNLRYFELDDLLPKVSARKPNPTYKLDDNWNLRAFDLRLCPKFLGYNPRKRARLDPRGVSRYTLTSLTIPA
ncbi:MAG: transposase [Turneriella sp.]|nr:transposase [Turneriella sp.]